MSETRIASSQLSATISALGAELIQLETAGGVPLLWHGDPAWWAGRAPLLFPIVGRVPDDAIVVDGRTYPLKQHGFARNTDFTCVDATPSLCTFTLVADAATRAAYPFDFRLSVTYAITDATLTVRATVTNCETERSMPFSFGFHPAFRWPVRPGSQRQDHSLVFSAPETSPISRPQDGLLGLEKQPSPVQGRVLPLADALFERGALIFDRLSSSCVTYRDGEADLIEIAFQNLPHLGIWTKPGAPFVCIEPWHGFAAPEGFAGELASKPGVIVLRPGTSAHFEMRVRVCAALASGRN